jgi:ubiquinone/menaquinone biosynthesis C-methylase UbiE
MSGATSSQETWDALFGDFYLRAYANSGTAEDEALAAVRLAGCEPGAEVLDVPCGFGRHAVALGAAGYHVTGVDRSEALLAEARRRAGEAAWPRFAHADYRELPFADASFDGALNLFSSLGYLGDEEDVRVLAEIRRVLRPDARLVVETMHRDALVLRWAEQDWRMVGEGRLLLEQRTWDPGSGVATTTQTLVDPDGSRESRTWSVRVYAATELATMLRAAGFAEVKCFGSFAAERFEPRSRLVVVARA